MKQAIAPNLVNAIESAIGVFAVKEGLLQKYHQALVNPDHLMTLNLTEKSIASTEASLASSLLTHARFLVLLCELTSKDMDIFLASKEASAHRIFHRLQELISESTIAIGSEESEQRLLKNLKKFESFLRPDTVSRRMIFR
jgi:hypothetical protein